MITNAPAPTQKELFLYPNPTSGILNIGERVPSDCEISLKDTKGTNVAYSKIDNQRIDLSSLVPGVYLLQIKTSQNTVFKRVIVTD